MIAIYIDKRIRQYENQVKYALDFIFKTLGYEYKYIKTAGEILSNDILIYYGVVHPTLEEAYELVFRKIMFYIPFESELYDFHALTTEKLRNCTLELEAGIPIFSTSQLFKSEVEENNGLYYCTMGFDLVGNVFFHLNNGAQEVFQKEDLYDNKFEAYSEFPFVNKYLQVFEAELEKAYSGQHRYFLIKKEMWPQAESLAVALSHTIDSLKKWDFKSIITLSIIDLFNFYRVSYFLQTVISKTKYLLTNYEEYWNFDRINELEREYSLRSTYFLGADKHNKSFDYDVDDTDLREELEKIMQRDCEIALLAPEYSEKEDIYASQKKIISDLTNKTRIGVRQQNHGYDRVITAELHEKNNFHYDSSQHYSQTSGFKNGLASVYRHYRKSEAEVVDSAIINFSTNHLEIPVAFAAGTLKLSKFKNIPFDKAKHLLENFINNASNIQGLFAYDFSLSSFADIKYAEDLFRFIQEKLSKIKTFKATYGEISSWCKKRDDVYIREKNRRINIYFPHHFAHFTFRILGDHKIAVIDFADTDIDGEKLIFNNIKADTNITIILEAQNSREKIDETE